MSYIQTDYIDATLDQGALFLEFNSKIKLRDLSDLNSELS